jgi:hypothetical protein
VSIDERLRQGLLTHADDVPPPPVELHLAAVQRRHHTRTAARVVAAVAAVALLAALPWLALRDPADDHVAPAPPGPSPTRPAPPPTPTVRNPVPDALHATWLVDLGRQQLRSDLQAAGFGAYADRFLRRERLGPQVTLAVTYDTDAFHVYWRQADGGWFDGWHGEARERDGVLTLTDAQSLDDTSYTWQVDGDELRLRFRSTTTADQGTIPFEAYSAAYFSRPLTRIDCVAGNLDACV